MSALPDAGETEQGAWRPVSIPQLTVAFFATKDPVTCLHGRNPGQRECHMLCLRLVWGLGRGLGQTVGSWRVGPAVNSLGLDSD